MTSLWYCTDRLSACSSLEMLPAGWLEAGLDSDSPAQSENNGEQQQRPEGSGSPADGSEAEMAEGGG